MKTIPLTVALCVLSSCANYKPASKTLKDELQGQSVEILNYKSPKIRFVSAGEAVALSMVNVVAVGAPSVLAAGIEGGMLGAIGSAFSYIDDKNKIQDPSVKISSEIEEEMQKSFAVSFKKTELAQKSNNIKVILKDKHDAAYLMDVKSENIQVIYYPTNWNRYQLSYESSFRLIDVKNKSVALEAHCKVMEGDHESPPTKEQLYANEATLLKIYIGRAEKDCSDQLIDKLH